MAAVNLGGIRTIDREVASLGRRYWTMWAATAVSSIGDGLALVAFPLLAASITHDPRLIAGVAVAQRLPWLLLSLPAGALADRLPRRRFLATVEVGRMAVLIVLGLSILTGFGQLAVIYAAAFALGGFETGYAGGTMSAVPALVDAADLPRANGYLFAAQTSGEQFIGPAIGGAIFAARASLPFLADALTFAASAMLLAQALPRERAAAAGPRPALLADTREGLRWFLSSRTSRSLAAIVSGFAFCQAMVLGILVLFCVQTLGLGPGGYGVFLAVGALGNVGGGLVAGRVHRRFGTRRVLIGGGIAAAAAYVAVGVAPTAGAAALAFVVEATAVALGNVASVSLRQELIPSELLGRVGNVFRLCIFGVMPFGAVAGGLLGAGPGLRVAIVVAGVIQAFVVLLAHRRLPAEGSTDASALPAVDGQHDAGDEVRLVGV